MCVHVCVQISSTAQPECDAEVIDCPWLCLRSREQQCQDWLQLGLEEPQNAAGVLQTRLLYIAQAGLDLEFFLPVSTGVLGLQGSLNRPQGAAAPLQVSKAGSAARALSCSQSEC